MSKLVGYLTKAVLASRTHFCERHCAVLPNATSNTIQPHVHMHRHLFVFTV